jgi:tetrahydromethanopterin S-methyltransferase subunit G
VLLGDVASEDRMQKYFIFAALLTLSACQPSPDQDPSATNAAEPEPSAKPVSEGSSKTTRDAEDQRGRSELVARRLDKLETKVGSSFGSAHWDSVSKRLDKLEEKVGSSSGSAGLYSLSKRLDKVEEKIGSSYGDSMSRRLDRLEERVGASFGSAGWDSVSKRLDRLEESVKSLSKELENAHRETRDMKNKQEQLESKVRSLK